MTETLLVQAFTGLLAAGIGSFSSYKLLEYRITKVEVKTEELEKTKLETATCTERRAVCDPCKKKVEAIVCSQDQLIHCVNKYVDDCKVGVK